MRQYKGLTIPDELTPLCDSDILQLLFTGITPTGCHVNLYNAELEDKCLEVTMDEVEQKFGCHVKIKGNRNRDEWFPTVLRENCDGPFTYPLFFKDSNYARRKEEMNEMPELKPGDVFKDIIGRWIIVVTEDEGYSISPDDPQTLVAQCKLVNYTPVKLYRNPDSRLFEVCQLDKIVSGDYAPYWEYSSKAVEMTMSQLKEKLGYEVKIVGEKE